MQDFQHIATFTYPSDLLVAKSLLESMNIECNVKNEFTIQVHNFYSNAIGGIILEVPSEKYKDAKSLFVERGFENYLLDFSSEDGLVEQESEKITFSNILIRS